MQFDLIENWKQKIPKRTKCCFVTGMIVGLLTHFYMLTHKLPNWDDLNNIGTYGSGDYLGRWFLKFIHPLGGDYSIPAVHGVLMIVCLSLAACFVLEIAQIKSITGAILVPMVMVTFTSVACTMTFMFMAHTSGIGILMACVAVYVLRKYRFGWILSIALIIATLGTYQSYVSIVITLMLIGMIRDLMHERNALDIIKKGVVCVLLLGVSVGAYMVLSHVIYPNLDNETYGGVGNMGQIAISQMPILIARCYKRFLEFFLWKPFAFMTRTSQWMNIATCVLAVGFFFYLVLVKQLIKKPLAFALELVLCGFVPLAAAFIYFMAPDVDYSMLMLYSYALIYVLVIAFLDECIAVWNREGTLHEKTGTGRDWHMLAKQTVTLVTVVVILISCYTDYLVTNKAYMRTEIAFERVNNYFNRMIAKIENTSGYQSGDQATIVGNTYYKENPSTVEFDVMDSEDLREMSGVALENGLLTSGARDNYIRFYVGFDMAQLSEGDKEKIAQTEQYQKMPAYPEDGCVEKIDDIWVLKMCE